MEFRKATAEDLSLLIDTRMAFVESIAKIENPAAFKAATEQYFAAHLNDGSLFSYICVETGKILSSCLLCVYTTVPIPSALSGKSGLLLNVYTVKEHRRKGLAKKLILMLIEEARRMGVSKIMLDYTEDGLPLYQSLGFIKSDDHMEMKL